MPPLSSNLLIATILRHDRKVTSYKIALIRALNDVVLSYPDVAGQYAVGADDTQDKPAITSDVAVPLRMLAQFWVAYYWPFADARNPIRQGQITQRGGAPRADISFRPALEHLRTHWEELIGTSALPSDGFFLRAEFQTPRRRASYPLALQGAFDLAVKECMGALGQPIRYAGEGEYGLFERPLPLHKMIGELIVLPGTRAQEVCLRVSASLWASFRELSLWIEALCIHEWSLFTESIVRGQETPRAQGIMGLQRQGNSLHRGDVYFLLTAHPRNRRPLTWERNRIEILMMEGARFQCPWTKKVLTASAFDIDHLLPLAVYPANELWNLVPADRTFNQHIKRDRIPSLKRLLEARPVVENSYAFYEMSPDLKGAMHEDAGVRFAGLIADGGFSTQLSIRAMRFIEEVAGARGVARF